MASRLQHDQLTLHSCRLVSGLGADKGVRARRVDGEGAGCSLATLRHGLEPRALGEREIVDYSSVVLKRELDRLAGADGDATWREVHLGCLDSHRLRPANLRRRR